MLVKLRKKHAVKRKYLVHTPFLIHQRAQTSLTQNCLKLTVPGFHTTYFLFLVVTLAFKKSLGQVLTWKSGLKKLPFLPLGPSCTLQTTLLSDLVGCGSPLQIVMAIWHTFLKFEARQTAIIVCSGLPHPIQQIKKKYCTLILFLN